MPNARYLKYREKILAYAREHREQVNAIKHRYVERYPDRVKASKKKYAEAHIEEKRQSSLAYYYANIEHCKERLQQWQKANPEKMRAKSQRHYAKNRDKSRISHQKWVKNHPERWRALVAKYRARKAQAPINDLTAEHWAIIKAHNGHRCVYCGRKIQRLTQDHLTPLSKRGPHTMQNVLPACSSCNSKKRDRGVLKPVQPLLL